MDKEFERYLESIKEGVKKESSTFGGTMEGVRVLTRIHDKQPKEKVEEEMKEFTEFKKNYPSHIDEGFYQSVKKQVDDYIEKKK